MGGTNHTTETSAEIIAQSDEAVDAIRGMDNDALRSLSFEERFDYIAKVRNGLYARFPAPEDDPYQEIEDTEDTRNHIGVLRRITNSISLSSGYEDFIINVTKAAAEDLARNRTYVQQLLDWNNLEEAQRLSLIQTFHGSVIGHAQLALKKLRANDGVVHMVKPLRVTAFTDEPEPLEDGSVDALGGYASLNHETWPGVNDIAINVHPDAGFDSAAESIETIAHESAHVIEGFLAFTFGHHAPFVPDQLVTDAKLLYHMYEKEAYIIPRLETAYREQTNEVIARTAGETACQIMADAMVRMAPS